MDTQPAEWVYQGFKDLADEVRELGTKHNQLVDSVSRLWAEVHRTSCDPLFKKECLRQLDHLNLMVYPLDQEQEAHPNYPIDPEIKIPSSDHTAWD